MKTNIFQLTWRKLWIVIVGGFLAILLHNLFFAIFGFEDAVFFIIVIFILPIYMIIAIIYSLINKFYRRENDKKRKVHKRRSKRSRR